MMSIDKALTALIWILLVMFIVSLLAALWPYFLQHGTQYAPFGAPGLDLL